MCKEFRMLVEQNDQRYIAQCEHETVHLRWDSLTLSFQPDAFLKLGNQIIQEHTAVARMFPSITPPTISVPKTKICLRISTIEMEFPPSELPELLLVLRIACALLAQPSATVPIAARHLPLDAPMAIQRCPRQSHFAVIDHLN